MDGTNVDLIKKILRIRAQHVLRRRQLVRAVRAESGEHSSPKTQAPSSHSSPKLHSIMMSSLSPSMSSTATATSTSTSTSTSPSFSSRRSSMPYSGGGGGYEPYGHGPLPRETSPSPRSIRPRDSHPSILSPVAWREDALASSEDSTRMRSKPRTTSSKLEMDHIEHIYVDGDGDGEAGEEEGTLHCSLFINPG
jgi:hypothetical protein